MATRKVAEQVQPGALLMNWRDVLKIGVAGAIIGLLTMGLYVLFDKYVFSPTLCSDINLGSGRCENKLAFSSSVALVIGALPILFFFVQQRVYRPLLVILLSVVTLWNIPLLLGELAMLPAILLSVLIFALTYLVFAWLVQIRNFPIALITSIIVVVIVRVIILV
jgi:hypothetical protein